MFLTLFTCILNGNPPFKLAVKAPCIISVSLFVGIGSITKEHERDGDVSPDKALQVAPPEVIIDYALIEYKEGIFHLGMNTFTMPPDGI